MPSTPMSKASRAKGNRVEREIAKLLTEAGVPTRRVIGSGAHGAIDDRLVGDLQIGTLPNGAWCFTGEVKARKNGAGFKTLEGWLGTNDLLILRRNNADPMCVIPWALFATLAKLYYEGELDDE